MNLLTETIDNLRDRNLTSDNVLWVGSRDGKYAVPWGDFAILANKEYDSGFGGTNVVDDLVVVGEGWWLERHEYDGSEWWEFKQQPLHREGKEFNSVFKKGYESSIAEMMEGGYGREKY